LPRTKDISADKNSSAALVRRLVAEYVRPYLGQILLGMFWMAVAAAATAANAWLMEPILDEVFLNKDKDMLLVVPVAIFTIAIIKGTSTFLQGYISGAIGQRVIADVQKALYAHLMRADLAYFQAMASGKLVSNFLTDANMLREAVSKSLTGMVKDSLTASFLIALMFYQDWRLALATFFVLPLAAVPVRNMGRRLRKASVDMQERTGLFAALLTETLQGAKHVKTYAMERYESDRANAAIDYRLIPVLKSLRTGSAVSAIMEALGGIAIAVVVFYGGNRVIDGATTPGAFFSFIAALLMAYQPIKSLANLNSALQGGLGAAQRIFDMLDHKPDIADAQDACDLDITAGEIEFQDVHFDYADGTQAINGVSFDVPAGSVVALVGASGSGKSTLLNLIPRFFDISAGSVQIDGQDVRDTTLTSLRNAVALVTQDATLFDDTVRANIAYGRMTAPENDIKDAAEAAAADHFIESLKDGYDTVTGEDGTRLSGGQRQRIAIARAMLKDAPILLLDEATSALDSESERKVQEALRTLMKGRTSLVVAHRLSTIIDADKIHVLEGGKIVESGTHAELLSKNGAYARLWHLQSGGRQNPTAVEAAAVGDY
jgi:ATP-binding cassette, subfamily B, bacterial MsbA